MTTIEIMALIVASLVGIKLLVILINPKSWMVVIRTVYAKPTLTILIALALGAVTLNNLLKELTIVQIFGAILFLMFLMVIGFAVYSKETVTWAERFLEDKSVVKKAWLAIVIWVALVIWVFYALLV